MLCSSSFLSVTRALTLTHEISTSGGDGVLEPSRVLGELTRQCCVQSGRLLRLSVESGDWRIVGRGSSLYGVFKSAKNTEHSFLCDPQGKRERGPALLATPGLEASPRGQREPLRGLGGGTV